MSDELLSRLLAWVETWGVWLSWLAWATVFFGALAMLRATRGIRGTRVWWAAFYLGHRARLFPRAAGLGLRAFLFRMGERSTRVRDRGAALFTVFAFFFAGLTIFYFYIAYQNSVTDRARLDRLPSTPVAVLAYVALLVLAFIALTYRAYRRQPAHAAQGAGK